MPVRSARYDTRARSDTKLVPDTPRKKEEILHAVMLILFLLLSSGQDEWQQMIINEGCAKLTKIGKGFQCGYCFVGEECAKNQCGLITLSNIVMGFSYWLIHAYEKLPLQGGGGLEMNYKKVFFFIGVCKFG